MRIVASREAKVVVFTTSAQRCYSTRTKSYFVPQEHFRDRAEWWEDCSCGHFCSLCRAAAPLHFCAFHYYGTHGLRVLIRTVNTLILYIGQHDNCETVVDVVLLALAIWQPLVLV